MLWAAETHRRACPHPGILWPTRAAFCPLVPTTMSHTISSCQISPVTLGQVPTHIVPLSVSRHRQLLGRVTPCYSGLRESAVARELVVLSSNVAAFGCFLKFVNKIYEHWNAHRIYEMYLIYGIRAINQSLKLWKMLGFNRQVLKLVLEFEPNP